MVQHQIHMWLSKKSRLNLIYYVNLYNIKPYFFICGWSDVTHIKPIKSHCQWLDFKTLNFISLCFFNGLGFYRFFFSSAHLISLSLSLTCGFYQCYHKLPYLSSFLFLFLVIFLILKGIVHHYLKRLWLMVDKVMIV